MIIQPSGANFNPRSRVGSDSTSVKFDADKLISIHAPVWGATAYGLYRVDNLVFQSTLPCGERPPIKSFHRDFTYISIHAPVWGATSEEAYDFCDLAISIHAPVWGATKIHNITDAIPEISIHAPVWGATTLTSVVGKTGRGISIHAPVWGATCRHWRRYISLLYFNPRSRVGSDCFFAFIS